LQKRIAVIGSGISGLVSAYLLNKQYDITLFEANNYIGGHTNTVDLEIDDHQYAIDTGFIVFNKATYPNFCKLIDKLGVAIQKSEMSFSFRSDAMAMEYNGHSLNTLFSDRSNLVKPAFYKMLNDITRFNRNAKSYIAQNMQDFTVAEFIQENRYAALFTKAYLIPMAAAIWSAKPAELYAAPARFIFNFFANHGLLDVANRPQWYVVAGGSRNYIEPLIQDFRSKIFLNAKVDNIRHSNNQVILTVQNQEMTFDAVIIATHSDQALRMLANPTQGEDAILSAIPYQKNEVVLHSDSSVLPKKRRAWASWNYLDSVNDAAGLTYYMNRLQNIDSPIDFCVSVNQSEIIQPEKIFERFSYSHPCFTQEAQRAQSQHAEINGKNNIYYCGAYWGNGFHEDGVKSALDACEPLGIVW
jgi:predicted NAD/FAD-binding protein